MVTQKIVQKRAYDEDYVKTNCIICGEEFEYMYNSYCTIKQDTCNKCDELREKSKREACFNSLDNFEKTLEKNKNFRSSYMGGCN